MRKELLSSAPWRGEEKPPEEFPEAKLKVTRQQPGKESTMHVPRKRSVASKKRSSKDEKASRPEFDPELAYSFQRNIQFLQRVFSIDTIVKPLPPAMAFHASRSLGFFTRIFTQFWEDPSCKMINSLEDNEEYEPRGLIVFVVTGTRTCLPEHIFCRNKKHPIGMENLSMLDGIVTICCTPQLLLPIDSLVKINEDPKGIAAAQKSLGLGQEEKVRRVR